MRFLYLFLLFFYIAGSATAATCPAGYDDVSSLFSSTFYSKNDGVCPFGYEPYSAPSTFYFRFNGVLLDSGADTCEFGSHYVNGECVSYASDNCPNDYNHHTGNDATFYSKNSGTCPSGYEVYSSPSSLYFRFNGVLLGSGPTTCASGHYVNGTCSDFSSSGCITGYVDIGSDDAFASIGANGSCPSGYTAATQNQSCNSDTTAMICTTLCNGGMLKTGAGYCSDVCGIGLTVLHVGDVATFPVYGTRTTTPSLVVSDGEDTCYVNMAPGNTSNTLKALINNTVYHTTD